MTPEANLPEPKPRNEVWDALSEIFGEPETPQACKIRGRNVRELKSANATRDEIFRRARTWPQHFENATLTEFALVKWWTTLGRPPLRSINRTLTPDEIIELGRRMDEQEGRR